MGMTSRVGAVTVNVGLDKPGAAVSPTLHGVFFEDINFGADGGLYPQRIKNGSFVLTPDPTTGWQKTPNNRAGGTLSILGDQPLNENNPHYLRFTVLPNGDGFGLYNEGFHGIGLKQGAKYTFSVYAKAVDGQQPMTLQITLLDGDRPIGSGN